MSRRDTIIIAVLINAGLLVVLFASALKSDPVLKEEPPAASAPLASISELPLPKENAAAFGDEVDQVLRDHALPAVAPSAPLAQPLAATSSLAAPEGQKTELPAVNFAEDLQSFAPPPASPIKPVETQAASATVIELKVKKGDVLEKIARMHRTNVEEIMKLNQLSSTRLKIGQVLKIPQGSGKKEGASSSAKADLSVKYYTVKNGDNPWTIAVKNHMKVEELLKLNNMNEEKARRLKAGDQLRIR